MKSKFFLTLSIALNVVAVLAFVISRGSSAKPVSTKLSIAPEAKHAATPATIAQQPKPFDASKVTWVQALRDARISEKIIADVASANFEDSWHAQALENQKKFERGEITQAVLTGFDFEHDE